MLPLLFELLNHLHKRPIQLGKGNKKATRSHRPLSKDLNSSKNHRRSVKKVSFEKKHGLMLLVKKNHQKTARDLN
jgi:hypothetical protein